MWGWEHGRRGCEWGESIPGYRGSQLPQVSQVLETAGGVPSSRGRPTWGRPRPSSPSCLHLHFASFQSVEVFRSTFAAMARGAQVRTPALRPTAAAPPAPTPAGVRARGPEALRDAGGPHALLRVRVAHAEGPGQGRGARNSCPAARSCARRPDTRLCRDMSGRRGAAPRPLDSNYGARESLPLIYSGTGWRVPARGDLLQARGPRGQKSPGAPLSTLELVVPAGWVSRCPHPCAPARDSPRPGTGFAQR